MSKNKSAKYKIINTDITNDIAKKIVGKQVTVEKIRAKGGPGDGGRKPGSKNKMTLDKLAKIVTDGFAEQAKFNTRIEKEVLTLGNRLDRVIKVNNLKE